MIAGHLSKAKANPKLPKATFKNAVIQLKLNTTLPGIAIS